MNGLTAEDEVAAFFAAVEGETVMTECPGCAGTGKAPEECECGCGHRHEAKVRCRRCDGTGEVRAVVHPADAWTLRFVAGIPVRSAA